MQTILDCIIKSNALYILCYMYMISQSKKIKCTSSVANVLILEKPGMSTSKERLLSPWAAEPEKQKEACVTDNWKSHSAYIKTSQTEKTNSGFNYEPK